MQFCRRLLVLLRLMFPNLASVPAMFFLVMLGLSLAGECTEEEINPLKKKKGLLVLLQIFIFISCCCGLLTTCGAQTKFLFSPLVEEMVIYNTGLIPSRFYAVLTAQPIDGFQALVLQSVVLVVAVAVINSLVTLTGVLCVYVCILCCVCCV